MMRAIILLVCGLSAALLPAQTQRMVLVEEFTNASCGPCAAANPALNATLDANMAKVVALKYQTDWPGTDPMNAQTNANVDPRVTYYNVSGVPAAYMDGVSQSIGGLSQNKIDTEYAIPSPFKLELSHQFSNDMDSVFIECKFTCLVAVPGTHILHVALTEEEIHFTSAPGANGETVFHDVMRDMYPSAAGTALPASLINPGQTQTFTFARALPAYIYDNNQIRTVAFVQESATKAVGQAAYSSTPLRTDASLSTSPNFAGTQCGNATFSIPFNLVNAGLAPLKSVTITSKADNGTPVNIASGLTANAPLAPGASKALTIPTATYQPGQHTIVIRTSNPNQKSDDEPSNDSMVINFVVTGSQQSAPFADNYTSAALDPNKYVIMNPDLDDAIWQYNGNGNYNTGSARFPFFISPAGSHDDLYLPPIAISGTQYLVFDLAYAQYQFPGGQFLSTDTLAVMASTDCGGTWTSLWEKSGTALATSASLAGEFIPKTVNDWKNHSVSLAAYEGQAVLIKFAAKSNYGNHLYIDNLNISNSAVNISKELNASLMVAPNPAREQFTASFSLGSPAEVNATLYNITGQAVKTVAAGQVAAGNQQLTIATNGLSAGVYTLVLQAGENTATTRLIISE